MCKNGTGGTFSGFQNIFYNIIINAVPRPNTSKIRIIIKIWNCNSRLLLLILLNQSISTFLKYHPKYVMTLKSIKLFSLMLFLVRF